MTSEPLPAASPAPRLRIRETTVRGRQLEYVETGSGPIMLLVHGTGGSWQIWGQNLAALGADFRVVAPSLPGCGASQRLSTKPKHLSPYVATLVALLDQLGAESAIVVGHSLGGLISLRLAVEHPERVDSLVLVDSGGMKIGRMRLALITWTLRLVSWLCRLEWLVMLVSRRESIRTSMLDKLVSNPADVDPLFLETMLRDFGCAGVPESIVAGTRDQKQSQPVDVRVPIHLIWGEDDNILPLRLGEDFQRSTPRATLDVIASAGHAPMVEQPRRFEELLRDLSR